MKTPMIVVILLFFLAACGPVLTEQPVTPTATSEPTFTSIPPTQTVLSTETPSPTPTSPFPLERLRMAFVTDGNLYLQDGSNSPTQLTDRGEDHTPFFSDDGEKIVFYRGETDNLFSINADGSNEQVLVTNDFLKSINSEYDETTEACNLTFAPGTRLLLFSTCSHQAPGITFHNGDLFIVDTDTGQIKNLFLAGRASYFYVSPDGSMMAINRLGSIDIVSIDGKMIRRNLLTYIPSEPIPLAPRVYWVSNSSELIVALPIDTVYDDTYYPPTFTLWRYSLDTGEGIQINLDPPVMGHDEAKVSPDGNWITYENYEQSSFYIGDLRTSRTKLYEPSPGVIGYYDWNRDSTYSIYEDLGGILSLGSFNEPPVYIGKARFMGWVNDTYFLYFLLHEGDLESKAIFAGAIDGESRQVFSNMENPFQYKLSFAFVFPNSKAEQ